jgi:adenylate kinase
MIPKKNPNLLSNKPNPHISTHYPNIPKKTNMEIEESHQGATPSRPIPNILVTGVPGSGKTTFCSLLAAEINNQLGLALNNPNLNIFRHVNVGQEITANKLYTDWDSENNCSIYDLDMVCDYLEPHLGGGGCIVDFHSACDFPERWFDLVVLLRCNNTVLYDRLKPRGYSEEKIKNNIECEILEVMSEEVYEAYDKSIVLQLGNEKEEDMSVNMQTVFARLKDFEILKKVQGMMG